MYFTYLVCNDDDDGGPGMEGSLNDEEVGVLVNSVLVTNPKPPIRSIRLSSQM